MNLLFGYQIHPSIQELDECVFHFVIVEPSPPINYRFSVGQLPAWAKKQVN